MKKLFFAFIALATLSVNAQNGITNPYRFGQGEDTTRCKQSISIMNTNVKNGQYKIAYEAWKVLFDEFPVARVDTYTNGIKILTDFIAKEADPQKKAEYIDMLIAVYDQELKYLDKLQEITKTKLSEGQILGRKVIDYLKYHKDAPVDTVYAMLAKSVELEKGQSEYVVTELFMKYSGLKYKNDPSHGEQIIEDYLNASVYIVDVLDKYHDNIELCEKRYAEKGNSKDSINAAMKAAATESFGYNTDEIVSSDVIGMRYGSLFDATQTMVAKIDDDTYQVQVVSWYDNENSYTSQMVRTIKYFAELA